MHARVALAAVVVGVALATPGTGGAQPQPDPAPTPTPTAAPLQPADANEPVGAAAFNPGGVDASAETYVEASAASNEDATGGGGGSGNGGSGSEEGGNATDWSSGGGAAPSGPAGPPSLVICEIVGAVNANCHTSPVDAPGEGGGVNPPEGQVPVFDPEPGPAPAPYVPSQAEIDATILAAYQAAAFPNFTLQTAPPGDLDAPLITQLATFLWVDPAQWQPITATAEIPGYLTVTATAIPTSMWWSGGESGPIECYPPGIAWYPGAPEECTMTYKTSSATNDHELRLTVTWEASYTCSAYCTGGDLDPVTNDHVRPVRVAEIQSIVTSGG